MNVCCGAAEYRGCGAPVSLKHLNLIVGVVTSKKSGNQSQLCQLESQLPSVVESIVIMMIVA